MPSSLRPIPTPNEPLSIAAARLAAGNATWETISTATRLRAKRDEHGSLLVESLDGGPAFRRPPDPDPVRGLAFLKFSPNGRILAVCDTDMFKGSIISILDVTPATACHPP